jgi:hypothetical protein
MMASESARAVVLVYHPDLPDMQIAEVPSPPTPVFKPASRTVRQRTSTPTCKLDQVAEIGKAAHPNRQE